MIQDVQKGYRIINPGLINPVQVWVGKCERCPCEFELHDDLQLIYQDALAYSNGSIYASCPNPNCSRRVKVVHGMTEKP